MGRTTGGPLTHIALRDAVTQGACMGSTDDGDTERLDLVPIRLWREKSTGQGEAPGR